MPTVRLVKHGLRQVVVGTQTISIILPVLSSSSRPNTFLSHCVIGEKQPQVDMVVYGYDSIRIRKGRQRCNAMQRKKRGYLMTCTEEERRTGEWQMR